MLKKQIKYSFLVLGVIISAAFFLKGNLVHETFNSKEWIEWVENEGDWSLRWDMMNSLRNNHNLKEKNKSEILKLLGNPSSKSKTEFYYYLGMAKSGIDTGTLMIKFDEKENVTNFKVYRS